MFATMSCEVSSDQVGSDESFPERYNDLHDRHLAATLTSEDAAEACGALSPHERITCSLHRRWAHQCIASPLHVIPVTGHRWCRRCAQATTVIVDELDGLIALRCPRCLRTPNTMATRQIIRTCKTSLAQWKLCDEGTGRCDERS